MLNEWQEFLAYTGPVTYKADGKKDTSWLGRFTFEALRDFGGLSRILTILARGFLFHGPNGAVLDGEPRGRMDFARDNPKVVRKAYFETAGELDKKFDAEWRKRVRQFQMPLFSSNADAAWITHFDDVMADALELGPLRRDKVELPEEPRAKIEAIRPEKLPAEVIHTLIAYYATNRLEDSDWVVLPVANFDCWFGDTNFGRKYLSQIPEKIIQRSNSFGVSRYRVLPEFLP